jgi:hypothetical protein
MSEEAETHSDPLDYPPYSLDNLVNIIYNKIFNKKYNNTMLSNDTEPNIKNKIKKILTNSRFSDVNEDDHVLYDNFKKFLEKMKVSFVVDFEKMIFVEIELHDTIGLYTPSESSGDRCNALNRFYTVITNVVQYINGNNQMGFLNDAGIVNYRNSGYSISNEKKFNFQARIKNSGSSFKKSYRACNNGMPIPLEGGSKSRRTRRRKHNRKTHNKRVSKTHKRRRHSRSVRKHKKHTSRR